MFYLPRSGRFLFLNFMALFYDLPVYPVKLLCQAEGLFNGVNRDTYKLILKIFEFTRDFSKEYKYMVGESLKKETIEFHNFT